MLRTVVVAAITATTVMGGVVPPATASNGNCGWIDCQSANGGVELRPMARQRGGLTDRRASSVRQARGLAFESTTTPGCPANDPNTGGTYDMACAYMAAFCRANGQGDRWLTWIWTRRVSSAGTATTPWRRTGYNCEAPGAVAPATRPALTRDLIARAFARLPFARPRSRIQPEGNRTLVNLPTYYETTWPRAGYAPAEIATVTLLGRDVRIRPSATYRYFFGDGTSVGPTASTGGGYPSGDIRHTYVGKGTVQVRIRADYTGQYSIDGGAWQPIGLTVPVTGPAVAVTVLEARARILAGGA